MINETTETNYIKQLTMDLEIEFRNELDIRRRSPCGGTISILKTGSGFPMLARKIIGKSK